MSLILYNAGGNIALEFQNVVTHRLWHLFSPHTGLQTAINID